MTRTRKKYSKKIVSKKRFNRKNNKRNKTRTRNKRLKGGSIQTNAAPNKIITTATEVAGPSQREWETSGGVLKTFINQTKQTTPTRREPVSVMPSLPPISEKYPPSEINVLDELYEEREPTDNAIMSAKYRKKEITEKHFVGFLKKIIPSQDTIDRILAGEKKKIEKGNIDSPILFTIPKKK